MLIKRITTVAGLLLLLPALMSVPRSAHAGDVTIGDFFGGRSEKGSGEITSEDRDIGEFDRIENATDADLFITIGSPQKVTVTYDDNLLDNLKTRVRGKMLTVSARGSISSRKSCRIEITVPTLREITLAGSGDIEIGNLSGDEFRYELDGSGNLSVRGTIAHLTVELNGSGDVDARKLAATDVRVEINGSGDVRVRADGDLDGVINGSGDILYVGNPKHVSTSVNGSGSIQHADNGEEL